MLTKDFITAGKATFTIEPPADFVAQHNIKPHYTFKVKYKKGDDKWPDAYFVSLLTGPENTSDFTYLGMLQVDLCAGQPNVEALANLLVKLTRKSTYTEACWPVRILRRVLARLWAGDTTTLEAAGWKVHHAGKCGRCGRKLTVPESIESGIGPECIKMMHGQENLSFARYDDPLED